MRNNALDTMLASPCLFCGYDGPKYFHAYIHAEDCPWRKVPGFDNRLSKLLEVIKGLLHRQVRMK